MTGPGVSAADFRVLAEEGHAAMAAFLSAVTGTDVVPILGGFQVKETPAHWVHLNLMFFNWRVARCPKNNPMTYGRHWCFAGNDLSALLRAATAAAGWDVGDDTAPVGWNKDGQTGQWREPA